MKDSKKQFPSPTEPGSLNKKSFDFIAAGIGCNCLVLLYEAGILNRLLSSGLVKDSEIENCPHPSSIYAALLTLVNCAVVKNVARGFEITEFGRALSEQMGLIRMLFDGYGDLMAHQHRIVKGIEQNPGKFIRGSSISSAAVQLAMNTFDPVILHEFSQLKFSGTICDLGCGYGRMLLKICEKTGNAGLGFDNEPSVIKQAKKQLKNTSVNVELGNILNLQGIWEDVVVLLQCHVFHDFTPEENCVRIMDSYLNNFPNLKCFYYLDSVAPSESHPKILPGFDYIHGLLGIPTRSYEETIAMFEKSKYQVIKETPIPGLPNTFLWGLSPKNSNHNK